MKSLAYFISAVFIGGSLLAGCDTIENPIPLKDPSRQLSDSLALDSAEAARGLESPVQKVLLEDYTGHQCGNCPGASVVAKNQKDQYGDRLVILAVHAGYFAKYDKVPYTRNFTTPEGEEWATTFGVIANPNGMVNRMPRAGSTTRVQGVALWPAAIAAEMAKSPKASLNLTTLYRPDTRTVNIKVRTEYLESLPGNYNLAVFIAEDSIVSWQKNYGASAGGDPAYPVGDVEHYVHPHALRAAVTGSWGIADKTGPAKNTVTNSYFAYLLDPEWNTKKVSVVAFLYDVATRQIIQVDEEHLH